ncbi:hypothetical protein BB341_21585 [Streptomyces clavuligerus]|nr:hypothetical protein BB341_21585 [Streptomyces clavuligerus]AXU15243.1 hypothetical protein D1794_22460 [Streptomyces clavuligerus]QCS08019.1 hypothetical protein CRV15_21825 [Streptomyces clavuligerus]
MPVLPDLIRLFDGHHGRWRGPRGLPRDQVADDPRGQVRMTCDGIRIWPYMSTHDRVSRPADVGGTAHTVNALMG